ncbi:rod shape-determining protein MreD [Isobaculum melis]|uniref:Rod shape-determining protein MreD n=1 Tax=Isobaculum melis TaxID=142588 RepID=A0A1H9RIK1_9LACT|nr:rod shape-determining protein MreD [Isobaculum melis]SER71853.1 rod shape-determining protein MreD [Isobaculum melis]
MKQIWKKLAIPFLLILFFLLDGIFSEAFSSTLHTADYYMTPRLIVILLAMLAFFLPRRQMMIYAILFGLFYDIYYTDILGLHIALFPVIVYINEKMKNLLSASAFVIGMMLIINISLLESGLYLFYRTVPRFSLNMDVSQFLSVRLGPTLMLNIVLFIILYYPIRKMIDKTTQHTARNF